VWSNISFNWNDLFDFFPVFKVFYFLIVRIYGDYQRNGCCPGHVFFLKRTCIIYFENCTEQSNLRYLQIVVAAAVFHYRDHLLGGNICRRNGGIGVVVINEKKRESKSLWLAV